jgi:hypothetical protein
VKGFKVKKKLAEQFADACKRAGISQAQAISNLMHAGVCQRALRNGKQRTAFGLSFFRMKSTAH